MRAGPVAALLLIGIVWARPAMAEGEDEAEGKSKSESEAPPFRVYIEHFERVEALSDERHGNAIALIGRVTLEFSGVFSVRADRIVVWLDPKTDRNILDLVRGIRELGNGSGKGSGEGNDKASGVPLWAVRAVYAEGGRLPAVFQAAGAIFRCSSFYYDLRTHKGVFADTSLRLRRDRERTLAPDLVMRAKKLRSVGPGEWTADDVSLFSSNYHEPEVRIHVKRITIRDPQLGEALGELAVLSHRDYRGGEGPTQRELDRIVDELALAGPQLETKTLTMSGVRARFLKLPFFGWKTLKVDGSEAVPLRFLVDIGSIGSLGSGGILGAGLATKPVGFLLGGGYIDGRGPIAVGELTVDAGDGRFVGLSHGTYLRDHGMDFDFIPVPRDRWWFFNQYRWKISDQWRLDVEYDGLSDPTFLRVYDQGAFKEDKVQETYAYLRWRGRQAYAVAIYRPRTIDFQDYVEQLPGVGGFLPTLTLMRLGRDGNGEPVTLQLAGSLTVENFRHRQGILLGPPANFPPVPAGLPDFSTTRIDFAPELLLPFTLGPFRIVPFGIFRVTGYGETLAGNTETRFVGTAGLRIDTQLARRYRRFRHVVNLSLMYEDAYSVTVPAADLYPMDAIDRITPFEELSLRWRNRLLRPSKEGVVEFFNLEFFAAWFPEGQRPLGRTGDYVFEVDWEWLFNRAVWLESRLSMDPELGNAGSVGIWWKARKNLLLGTEYRHLEGDSDIVSLGVEYMVDTRWRLVGLSQWDLRNEDALEQALLIQRAGKTVVLGVRTSWQPGPDGFRFTFKIDLLESFLARRRKERDSIRREIGWK